MIIGIKEVKKIVMLIQSARTTPSLMVDMVVYFRRNNKRIIVPRLQNKDIRINNNIAMPSSFCAGGIF
jgi:hypothetical protein